MDVIQFGAVVHQSVRRVRSSRQLWLFHLRSVLLRPAELSSGDAPFVPPSRFSVRRANRPS